MPPKSIRTRFLSEADSARFYRDHPRIKPSPDDYCPTCDKDLRFYWQGEMRDCDCEMQLQLHKHYLASGIGVTYQQLSWDDYEGDPALRVALDKYLDRHANFVNRGIGLLLHGVPGTGKTLGVTLLMKELIKLGYDCYSTTFATMVEMFTAGWKSVEEQRYFREKIVLSDVLLLDDLGRGLRTKNNLSESTFDSILRSRVQDSRPTFLTTNMDVMELQEGYGGAVLSLLTEKMVKCEVQGTDFRSQANARMMKEVMDGQTRPIF